MFNIKRFDFEAEAAQECSSTSTTTTTATPISDRLAKLNARLNKNKPPPPTTSSTDKTTTIQDSIPHSKDTKDAKSHKKDRDSSTTTTKTNEISYKRSREEEDARVAREEARRQKDQQAGKQRWEKRAKELKDSDLIPNDVRLAMKAEAEARDKAEREAKKNPFAVAAAAAAAAVAAAKEKEKEDEDMKDAEEEDAEDKDDQDNQDQEEEEDRPALELEGIERFASEAAADAALAELAALVPLPTFETKEITALEKERAKSMGIPDWLAHPTLIEPGESNNRPIEDQQFGFSERLIKQCKKAGIEECFAVQTAVIPVLMRARHLGDIRKAPGDLCVSAPTGSGKTLAYVLPIIEVTSFDLCWIYSLLFLLLACLTHDYYKLVSLNADSITEGGNASARPRRPPHPRPLHPSQRNLRNLRQGHRSQNRNINRPKLLRSRTSHPRRRILLQPQFPTGPWRPFSSRRPNHHTWSSDRSYQVNSELYITAFEILGY